MEVTAIFESWHIGDGNYPPFSKGEIVNLSFELEPEVFSESTPDKPEEFWHLGGARYQFCATVLKVFDNDGEGKIITVNAMGFTFYILSPHCKTYAPGSKISGQGTLVLDHYIWVEFLDQYEDPPNLFHNLKVARIKKVQIPEKFIVRHEKGKALPARLTQDSYSENSVHEIETMEGQPFDEEFYVIDFDTQGLEQEKISTTFIG